MEYFLLLLIGEATAMTALSGIVMRDSIILVDFIQQSFAHEFPLLDAILESRVFRLRPILLIAGINLFRCGLGFDF